MSLSEDQMTWLLEARQFFVGHREAVGVLVPEGERRMLLKSGEEGGPWGGAQQGGVPRALSRAKIGVQGYAFTGGGPSQGNIATHVEGHAAAIMWQRGLKKAVLLVDRPMCSVCSTLLPTALPPGARLTVISEEEGETMVWSTHA